MVLADQFKLRSTATRYQPNDKHHNQDNDENAKTHSGFKDIANGLTGTKSDKQQNEHQPG